MASMLETDNIEKRYSLPKLKGDWDHSCTSSDPSESGTAYSSIVSDATSSTKPDDHASQKSTDSEDKNMRCKVEQRRFKDNSKCGFKYSEEVFPQSEIKHSLWSGSCIGQGSEYVVLMSSDSHYFVIKRKYAYLSKTICMFFSKTYPSKLNIMDFDFRIPSLTLHYVCKYLTYRLYYTKYRGILARPYFPIPSELALDITIAGYMLKC